MTVQPPSDLDYSDTKLLVEELRAHRHVWMGRSRRVLEGLRAADQPFRIHLVSPATRDKNFYILLTEGLSLHAMPAPPELAGKGLERIELMLLLPPTLPLENVRESWYVKLVTKLARQVMQQEDFLCWGSRFENGEPFVPDSRLCGGVLLNCGILPSAASICNIRPGLCVRYYQIMLLTRQELDYQAACGTDALLELLAGSVTSVTDLSRRNIADSGYLMDWEAIHAGTIRRKDLPRMEIEGFSHMAVYLCWCIEHNLMSEAFQQDFPEEIQKVLENEDDYFDLRTVIRDELGGELRRTIFNEEGEAFAAYYYDHRHSGSLPCYPADVDDYALHLFGEEEYHSEYFQDEAYLFIPFDEHYYQGMKPYIDSNYRKFQLLQKLVQLNTLHINPDQYQGGFSS